MKATAVLESKSYSFWYGPTHALHEVSCAIPRNAITALIGPSGCGKTTFLRSINRLHDLTPGARHAGDILLDGGSIFAPGIDVVGLRRRIGMVFQRPNPFPKPVYDNVAYGPRLNGLAPARELPDRVERGLRHCGTRCRTGSVSRGPRSREGSSSGCASRARWRTSRRSC